MQIWTLGGGGKREEEEEVGSELYAAVFGETGSAVHADLYICCNVKGQIFLRKRPLNFSNFNLGHLARYLASVLTLQQQ